MIRTENRHFYSNESNLESFYVPAFSQVRKVYIIESQIHMIIEYPDELLNDTSKIINLQIQKTNVPQTPFDDLDFKYFDTQLVQQTDLHNQSFGNSVELSTKNFTQIYHFFIKEIKSISETRDIKLDNIIK